MTTHAKDFDQLKIKLEQLQSHLEKLLQGAELDLDIARNLQKLLHQNRLPEIQGIKCLARYISAHGISSEGFDLISTKKGREVWMILSWAETFGLSSILLQSLVHLQSKALVESKSELSYDEVFNDLSHSLVNAKKAGQYRLCVAKFDMAHLKISGTAVGFAPFMIRHREKNQLQSVKLCAPEMLMQRPELLQAAISTQPVPALDAYQFHFSVPTGSRLYYLSSSFSQAKSLEEFKKSTQVFDSHSTKTFKENSDLVDDLNTFLMNAEDSMKLAGHTADITGVALEIDSSKLHLA